MTEAVYEDREQTAAKHLILRNYLTALAVKVGIFKGGCTLNYIDGFSGPWNSKAVDLSDTSPAIALECLTAARETVATAGFRLDVRGFFVSRNKAGAAELGALQQRFPSAEVVVHVGDFEDHLGAACAFSSSGNRPFTFVFIDPTGWTGFGLKAITRLLRAGHTEVLLNFMTGHISRFIDIGDAKLIPSFVDLFGDATYRDAWRGIAGLDREELMVETYCQRLRQAGAYRHCVSAVILKPTSDRTHYHLVYATNSDEGLVTFRETERRALQFQHEQRAVAQQRKRQSRTGQGELFGGPAMIAQPYEEELRVRYRSRAEQRLSSMVQDRGERGWDELVMAALAIPLVCAGDVKEWLRSRADLEPLGLERGERVPKLGRGHRIRLRSGACGE